MDVKLKRLRDSATIPTHGTAGSAGYDLYNADAKEYFISPGETHMFPTGWAMAIPEGHFGGVYARSGLSINHGLRPGNCVGVIDESYRGEVMVALHNDSSEGYLVAPGERIAQLVIHPVPETELVEVDELDDTERGDGGFGSTGR